MPQIELKDFLNESIRKEVKQILNSHNSFLAEVKNRLNPLSELRPEIFRRPLTFRLKQLTSIYDNLRKWKVRKDDLLTTIKEMHDLAGVRLTIATKDQFEAAEKIITEALSRIGKPRKIRKKKNTPITDTKNNGSIESEMDSGYDAVHYVVGDKDLKCEIQIRTLTQDLWAVFSHYESYKYEASTMTKRELVNYSKLMDVADDYAQLVKNRKINEAEKLHEIQSEKNGKRGITFKEFEDILTEAHNAVPGLSRFEWKKFDVLELCSALKLIHNYQIYSKEDLFQLINETETINLIKEAMAIHGLDDLSFFKSFSILCECHHHHKSALGPKNFGPSKTDYIDMMVRVYKLEDDFDKLAETNETTKILALLATALSLTDFRELNDCIRFNKLVRFDVSLGEISKIPEWADKLGLSFSVSDSSFLPIDEGKDNWTGSFYYCSDDEPGALRFVYFHSDKRICEIAKQYDAEENDLNFGLLLNYPKCCIESYLNWQKDNEDIDPITTITNSFKLTGELHNLNFPNPFTRYFGSSLVSHFPCSLNCSETHRKASESLYNLQSNFPDTADKILRLENSVVIFHRDKGICLWSSYNLVKNRIYVDRSSFKGQGELKFIFEKIDEIELSPTELLLKSNSQETSIFKTDDCFIENFVMSTN